MLIVAIGLYVLYWGLIYRGKDDIWDYMAVTGAIYFTGAFALLLGGLYWQRASSTGAFLALLAGMTAIIGLGPVQELLDIDIPSAPRRPGIDCRDDAGNVRRLALVSRPARRLPTRTEPHRPG